MAHCDWNESRRHVLSQARRIVIKVGSAVLARPGGGLDAAVVASLAAQIAALANAGRKVLLVSSGAVAAGREVLGRHYDPASLAHRQAASAIGQSRLMHAYDQEFARHGRIAAQVLLTRDDLDNRERYLNLRNTLATLFDLEAVPVVNENDPVAISELVYGDNDCLGGLLVGTIGAELFVNLTSARGVYAQNPDEHPEARPMSVIEDIAGLDLDALCGAKTALGTGGMHSKLLAARRVAQLGVPTMILAGREPDALTRAFAGEENGTYVPAGCKPIPRRKFWLAYHHEPQGTLIVDDGAVRALRDKGKSLLPAGIVDVVGDFTVGSMVRIASVEDESIGVGLTNYGAADLRKIMGLKSSRLEQVLGEASYTEAVHRDNMLIDAAI
ncbi:glutamate 5-kinase [Solidesulfovibrio fructosivorans JJ]]|uniref:Glutamate 5-kinase n=1 Tax=Solidesulfovibrio fructosivorans JJ] TaxID=596151 RepID=E1JYA0_SOLFR|nr:glutamate 5-kinase [Solidesulfovibrio fructosivorans]EFL50674.1 glutamate 5-kinase [Solidesulfovibrio fructosivorans JJ]]